MENCCNKTKQRTEEEKKKIIARLHKINGQINGVEKMINDDRYCDEVLTQLLAIEKSIKSVSDYILENHMKSCMVNHVQHGDLSDIDNIIELIKRFK
mgnify:FL=1